MKSISIKGKNNIDKINHIENHIEKDTININEKAIRIGMEDIADTDILHKKQIEMINKFLLEKILNIKR